MLEEDAAEPTARSSAKTIRIAAERCARIVKTFLSMARQRRAQRSEVMIDRILDASLDILAYNLRSSGIDVIDGPALYREIVRCWPELAERVIFVTGDALSATVQGFLAESGRPLLEKPFTAADVRELLARELGRPGRTYTRRPEPS